MKSTVPRLTIVHSVADSVRNRDTYTPAANAWAVASTSGVHSPSTSTSARARWTRPCAATSRHRARSSRPTIRTRRPTRPPRCRSSRPTATRRCGRGSTAACGAAYADARTNAPPSPRAPGESANHCAQLISCSAMRSSGTRDSPSSTGGGSSDCSASTRSRPPSRIVSRNTPSTPSAVASTASSSASLRGSPRADVPWVVVDEHAHAAPLELGDQLAEPRHVAVEVELVALVEADDRIGVPEHDGVEPTESLGIGEQASGVNSPRSRSNSRSSHSQTSALVKHRRRPRTARAAGVEGSADGRRRATAAAVLARPASRRDRRERRRSWRRSATSESIPPWSGRVVGRSIGRGTSGSKSMPALTAIARATVRRANSSKPIPSKPANVVASRFSQRADPRGRQGAGSGEGTADRRRRWRRRVGVPAAGDAGRDRPWRSRPPLRARAKAINAELFNTCTQWRCPYVVVEHVDRRLVVEDRCRRARHHDELPRRTRLREGSRRGRRRALLDGPAMPPQRLPRRRTSPRTGRCGGG